MSNSTFFQYLQFKDPKNEEISLGISNKTHCIYVCDENLELKIASDSDSEILCILKVHKF